VGNDATHGTLATVRVTAASEASRDAIARRCTELLGGFQIRHVVTFDVR
jgi:fatty-acyl-CoA synthase